MEDEQFTTYCGSMNEEELRSHVSGPEACEPCGKDFPEFVKPNDEK